jgi:hypothetical protein
MLAYCLFVTLLLGIMIGIAGTVYTAIYMEEKKYKRAMQIHPSSFKERLRAIVND